MPTGRPYEICRRCAMDTSDWGIVFDSLGQCNHCTDYLARGVDITYNGPASDAQFERMLDQVKAGGKGRDYDCVIGLSGGTDSGYLACLLKQHGIRPLAVHMDNGWDSEESVRNIKSLCDQLSIDYCSYVLDWEEFRGIQLAFLKASIVEMEIPTDIAIQGALHRETARVGAKYILSGGNLATEGIMPRSWFYYPKDSRLLRAICKKFGAPVGRFPTFDIPSEIYYKFFKGIKTLYPLNLVPYSKTHAEETLRSKINWIDYGAKHNESEYTKFVLNYVQPVKFGVDHRRATYSTLICTGQLTREDALSRLAVPPYNPATIESEKRYVAKKLALSLEELEAILAQPPLTYRDYPNNERLLDLVYNFYRRVFGKRSYAGASYDDNRPLLDSANSLFRDGARRRR